MEFERDGLVVLRGAFDATGMADAMWGALAGEHQVDRDDPRTWPSGLVATLTKWGKSGVFASVATPRIAQSVTALLGPDWYQPGPWGQPLITFPTSEAWDVPFTNWHIDLPATRDLSMVRMFAFLVPVHCHGGGTVVVAGSHRLVQNYEGMRSPDVRKRLAEEHEWFATLLRRPPEPDRMRRLMVDGVSVGGVDVRVVELTGEPGDVVLWHPALLHAGAPNTASQPRFMLSHSALRGTH